MFTSMQLSPEAQMARPQPSDVAQAAARIVAAFARTDTDAYFSGFDPQATFVFHTEPATLPDRAAYERLWAEWLESGWRVVDCESSNGAVTTFDGGAVFTHDVRTVTETPDGRDETHERESIVFTFSADPEADPDSNDAAGPTSNGHHLRAIHEHLSPAPAPAGAQA
jgi:hypothetical protein